MCPRVLEALLFLEENRRFWDKAMVMEAMETQLGDMKRRSSWILIELAIWWSTDSICLLDSDVNLFVTEKDSRFIRKIGVD